MLDVLVPTILFVSPFLGWMVGRHSQSAVDSAWEADKEALIRVLETERSSGCLSVPGVELYFLAKTSSATRFAQLMRELHEAGLVWSANGKCDLSDCFALAALDQVAIA